MQREMNALIRDLGILQSVTHIFSQEEHGS